MFISQAQHEFRLPPDSSEPDVQHWRIVELGLHAPWFVLSIGTVDAEATELGVTRTLCVAWDSDLTQLLRSLGSSEVEGLVCMVPPSLSANGQWESRVIIEVWECQSVAGRSVVLVYADGHKFECGPRPLHRDPVHRDLVFRLAQPPTDRAAQPRKRRVRRGAWPQSSV